MGTIASLLTWLKGFKRQTKQAIVIAIDIVTIIISVWVSFSLRYEQFHRPDISEIKAYLFAMILALPIFNLAGLYRSVFRYSGFSAMSMVAKTCMLYGVLYFIIVSLIIPEGIPRSVGIIQPLLLLVAVGASRASARLYLHPSNDLLYKKKKKERIVIYGAGSCGIQIATAIEHNARYVLCGFIDDDPCLQKKNINGVTVYGSKDIPSIIEKKEINTILIALPSIAKSKKQAIYKSLEGLGVIIRTIPDLDAIAGGKVSISDIREIDIEDLLGRDPVPPIKKLISKCIQGKIVLVTGAGGSIGSELCRQIITQNPIKIILYDNSEYNLYAIDKELKERIINLGLNVVVKPVLGDVNDKRYTYQIIEKYKPETVYHAAAYKHVPMVEENPCEGIKNNVFGTLSVAEACINTMVKNMVLISTDKAVRPTNVMGASKRIAELVLQAMSSQYKDINETCFSIVRFGNVLGSSGSVVPLFRQQINDGGPVTVTHKDMTRYFMTIPEAAQLVIQAGAMANGGEVFLLDMGQPVKIIELAKRMIELSGLTVKDIDNPDGDIALEITGLRPGEKLYEELLIGDNPCPTEHPRIFKAHEKYMSMQEIKKHISLLENYINDGHGDIVELKKILRVIVSGYQINNVIS